MPVDAVNLAARQEELLATARTARAGRAADTVYGSRDTVLRQTMIALLEGSELAAHDGPPEATLHVLTGRARLIAGDRAWELSAGELIVIPPERHSVSALEDSVLLLTVIRAVAGASEGSAS